MDASERTIDKKKRESERDRLPCHAIAVSTTPRTRPTGRAGLYVEKTRRCQCWCPQLARSIKAYVIMLGESRQSQWQRVPRSIDPCLYHPPWQLTRPQGHASSSDPHCMPLKDRTWLMSSLSLLAIDDTASCCRPSSNSTVSGLGRGRLKLWKPMQPVTACGTTLLHCHWKVVATRLMACQQKNELPSPSIWPHPPPAALQKSLRVPRISIHPSGRKQSWVVGDSTVASAGATRQASAHHPCGRHRRHSQLASSIDRRIAIGGGPGGL
jgi:hypothetical protein